MNLVVTFAVGIFMSFSAVAATKTATAPEYEVKTFFTSALEDTLPVDRIDIVHPGEQVVMYTTYARLADAEHLHVGKLFDAHGKLVHTLEHSFKPCGGKQRAWQWFRPGWAQPTGMWRFEAWLDGEKVLSNEIYVGVPSEPEEVTPPVETEASSGQ